MIFDIVFTEELLITYSAQCESALLTIHFTFLGASVQLDDFCIMLAFH